VGEGVSVPVGVSVGESVGEDVGEPRSPAGVPGPVTVADGYEFTDVLAHGLTDGYADGHGHALAHGHARGHRIDAGDERGPCA